MDILAATEILRGLADGVDPLTGEFLSDQCICNRAEVVRAFHCILRKLEQEMDKQKKKLPENAGKPWSSEDDIALAKMFDAGCSKKELRERFQRTSGAIDARLVRIGKINAPEMFRTRK